MRKLYSYISFVLFLMSFGYADDFGCTNQNACNYNPNAIEDDGSCLYFDCAGVCDGDALIDDCGTCSCAIEGVSDLAGCGFGIVQDFNADDIGCGCSGNYSGIEPNTYYFDEDLDGLGYGDSQIYCSEFDQILTENSIYDLAPEGWVLNNSDICPFDANDDSDGDGSCDSDDICNGEDDNLDSDLDHVADGCDICPYDPLDLDDNNDGVCDIQGPEVLINYPIEGEVFAVNHPFTIEYETTLPNLVDVISVYINDENGDWQLIGETDQISNTIDVTIESINSSVLSNSSIKMIAHAFNLEFESSEVNQITIINDYQSIVLEPGWHMIGLPLNLYNPLSENLFPTANVDDWTMFNSLGDFSDLDINFSQGYYLALNTTEELIASGTPIISSNIDDSDVILSKGWNLFSHTLMTEFSKYDIQINHLENSYDWNEAVNSGLICPTIYKWSQNQYQPSLSLSPWGAYWINTSNDDIILKFMETSNFDARIEQSENKIKLQVSDIFNEISSDEINIYLSDYYSEEFIYGEDEYNLDNNIKPEYIDMYIEKHDWIGHYDINHILLESPRFSTIRTSNNSELKTYNIKFDYSGIDETKLNWDVSETIEDDLHLLINDKIYKLCDIDHLSYNVSDISNMTLLVGDVNKFIVPDVFSLDDPYPNPFNPSTSVNFYLSKSEYVNASIFNIHGQIVDVILDEEISYGNHTFNWDASNYPSGIYFLRVKSKTYSVSQKLILIK